MGQGGLSGTKKETDGGLARVVKARMLRKTEAVMGFL